MGENQKPYDSYIGSLGFLLISHIHVWSELNTMSFLGYPLAYYMTAQGSLLAFVIMLFWTANKQEKIDEEHGFSEREED